MEKKRANFFSIISLAYAIFISLLFFLPDSLHESSGLNSHFSVYFPFSLPFYSLSIAHFWKCVNTFFWKLAPLGLRPEVSFHFFVLLETVCKNFFFNHYIFKTCVRFNKIIIFGNVSVNDFG